MQTVCLMGVNSQNIEGCGFKSGVTGRTLTGLGLKPRALQTCLSCKMTREPGPGREPPACMASPTTAHHLRLLRHPPLQEGTESAGAQVGLQLTEVALSGLIRVVNVPLQEGAQDQPKLPHLLQGHCSTAPPRPHSTYPSQNVHLLESFSLMPPACTTLSHTQLLLGFLRVRTSVSGTPHPGLCMPSQGSQPPNCELLKAGPLTHLHPEAGTGLGVCVPSLP